jgi:hypothetical protein
MQKNNNNIKPNTSGLSGSYSMPQLSNISSFRGLQNEGASRSDISGLSGSYLMPQLSNISSFRGSQNEGASRSDMGSSYSALSESFNRMGFGRIGSLGGTMGELEKASMRLGEAASQRRMRENLPNLLLSFKRR